MSLGLPFLEGAAVEWRWESQLSEARSSEAFSASHPWDEKAKNFYFFEVILKGLGKGR